MDAASDPFALDREKLDSIVESELGRRPASIEPIAAGLGARRFYRVRFSLGEPQSLIARFEAEPGNEIETDPSLPDSATERDGGPLLEAAPAWLPEPSLEPLRSFLEGAGLPVPRSYAHLPDHHLDLLEDLGDRTLLGASRTERVDLYREACGIIARLQRLSPGTQAIPAFDRIFDRALIQTKAWKWLHWTLPGLLGRDASDEEFRGVEALFTRIAELLEKAPRRLAHRDFKAENLHWIETGPGKEPTPPRLVMIDVQGAFMAPPEYDLVCLLYDLQVDLDESLIQECLRATLPDLPDAPDLETARLRFDAIAIVRLCKDISHLVQAGRVRDDYRRWHEIPRGLFLLEQAMGRLEHTFPEVRALTSVMHVLTAAVGSPDSSSQGRAR